jgi:hypothetical protein
MFPPQKPTYSSDRFGVSYIWKGDRSGVSGACCSDKFVTTRCGGFDVSDLARLSVEVSIYLFWKYVNIFSGRRYLV